VLVFPLASMVAGSRMTHHPSTLCMQLLTTLLTPFLPLATQWAEEQEVLILKKGKALTPKQKLDAKAAGVAHPEKIRIKVVRCIQPPKQLLLGLANKFSESLGPDTAGLTLGYGIFIRKDCENYRGNRELYVHEFVHVGQYERYGSIQAFLVDYLRECVEDGYPNGRLERQADRRVKKIVRG
jgi:hypothetical protein